MLLVVWLNQFLLRLLLLGYDRVQASCGRLESAGLLDLVEAGLQVCNDVIALLLFIMVSLEVSISSNSYGLVDTHHPPNKQRITYPTGLSGGFPASLG